MQKNTPLLANDMRAVMVEHWHRLVAASTNADNTYERKELLEDIAHLEQRLERCLG